MNAHLRARLLGARGNPYHSATLLKILEKLDDHEQDVLNEILRNIESDQEMTAKSTARRQMAMGRWGGP